MTRSFFLTGQETASGTGKVMIYGDNISYTREFPIFSIHSFHVVKSDDLFWIHGQYNYCTKIYYRNQRSGIGILTFLVLNKTIGIWNCLHAPLLEIYSLRAYSFRRQINKIKNIYGQRVKLCIFFCINWSFLFS